jgi:hypothetical protein
LTKAIGECDPAARRLQETTGTLSKECLHSPALFFRSNDRESERDRLGGIGRIWRDAGAFTHEIYIKNSSNINSLSQPSPYNWSSVVTRDAPVELPESERRQRSHPVLFLRNWATRGRFSTILEGPSLGLDGRSPDATGPEPSQIPARHAINFGRDFRLSRHVRKHLRPHVKRNYTMTKLHEKYTRLRTCMYVRL